MSHREKYFNLSSVHYKNEANKVANQRAKELIEILRPFIGKKVRLQTGYLSAKVDKLVSENAYQGKPKPLNNGDFAKISLDRIDTQLSNSLWLKISVCFHGGKYEDKTYYCHYEKVDIWLGRIKDGVLTDVENELPEFDEINVNEQAELISEYNALVKQLDTLEKLIRV